MNDHQSNRKIEDARSFEEAYERLEEMVRVLEEGGLSLEMTTNTFEEGMRLAQVCNEILSATELKITRLQTAFGDQMSILSEGKGESTEG